MTNRRVTAKQVKSLIGRQVVAQRRDGSVVAGKLVKIKGDRLILESSKGKSVRTKALLPLLLYDLAAVGTAPYAGAGFGGYGYGGYPGYGAYGAYGAYGGLGGYGYGPYGGGLWF
ncbi:hypothetical protein MO973_33730 [Paenibacillus sp. TRM 82003]|nr:hypothetical protein [Paenibacillus sp. TRM 82003]